MVSRERPLLKSVWHTLVRAVELFFGKKAFQASAALAYYTLFSIAPLLLIVITIAGIFLGADAVRGEIASEMQRVIGANAAELVEDMIRRARLQRAGVWPTILGVASMLFGATTVLAQLRSSLNAFWDVRAKPMRSDVANFFLTRLLSLGMLLTIGFLLLASLLASIALGAVIQYANAWIPVPTPLVSSVNVLVSLVVVTLMFALILRVLPDVRLSWRDVGQSAVVTGILFLVGQSLISMYVTRIGPDSPYGASGALVIVVLWVYYSALLVYFGTAIARALLEHQGRDIQPMRGAKRIRVQIVEPDEHSDGGE